MIGPFHWSFDEVLKIRFVKNPWNVSTLNPMMIMGEQIKEKEWPNGQESFGIVNNFEINTSTILATKPNNCGKKNENR